MNAGTKFAIGAVLIVGSVGYLMASGVKQTGQYYFTPSELSQKIAVDRSFYNVGMKVGARPPGLRVRLPGGGVGRVGRPGGRAPAGAGPAAERRAGGVGDVGRPPRGRVPARGGAVPPRLQRRVRRRLPQP